MEHQLLPAPESRMADNGEVASASGWVGFSGTVTDKQREYSHHRSWQVDR
jgi:hypothetical protein